MADAEHEVFITYASIREEKAAVRQFLDFVNLIFQENKDQYMNMFSISPKPVRIPVITPLLERKNSSKKSPKVRKKSAEKSSFFSRKLSWRSSNKWKPNWKALGVDKSKEWDVFTKDLKSLKEWLEEAAEFTQAWRAPEHNIVNIRTQLERHLAFALEVKTHQYQLENILSRGREFLESHPQLIEVLEDPLAEIETRWSSLESHLGIQSKQIQEALAVVETSIGSSSLQGADVEQIQDTLDHMTLRLTGHHTGLPGVEETHNNSNSYSDSALNTRTSQLLPCSSSPDFEALYSDLNDWLDDMQLAVTDSNDVFISEPQKEQMCQGYEQELQLREVSRSKLQRKGLQLMQSSNQNLAEQVRGRLDSLNQRWHNLQSKLLSPIKHKGSKKTRKDSSSSVFTTSDEAMNVAVEVEDVIGRLKGWVTTMEGMLFSSQGSLENLSKEQLEEKKIELEGLQGDIDKHAPGIEMVLNLCDLLMVNGQDMGVNKEQDRLKLNAFNLDRRWQAIQAQSRDLNARLARKMEEYKPLTTAEADHTFEALSPVKTGRVPHLWSMAPHRYHHTPSKDDDAVDGFTFRVNDLQRRLEIEELVIAREAFSENDAYSISDTSEVSLGDWDFDDVLPLKNGECHPVDDPGPGTPDIVDFADEIFDKYLEMESALRRSSAGATSASEDKDPDLLSPPRKDLEFWTVSPKETGYFTLDPKMVEARISDLISTDVSASPNQDDTCNNPGLFSGDEEYEHDMDELNERELLEHALWDLCSSSDREDEEDVPPRMKPPSCEEAAEAILQVFSFPLDYECPEDVFEQDEHSIPLPGSAPTSLFQTDPTSASWTGPHSPWTAPNSLSPTSPLSLSMTASIPMSQPTPTAGAQPIPVPATQTTPQSVTHADVRSILCQSWPMKTSSHPIQERSPSIEDLTTAPSLCPEIDRCFPSILGQELSFKETKRGLDSLRINLKLSASHGSSLRQSREDLVQTDNALLEITDKSLSHMYESLDLITELTSKLATDSLSTSPNSSEDYFSCVSDIDTASTFEAGATTVRSDMECDYIAKQEMAVRDSKGLFPVLFESNTDETCEASNWFTSQEVPENRYYPNCKLGNYSSHVSSTAQTAIGGVYSSHSEWEACIDIVSEFDKAELDTTCKSDLQESFVEESLDISEDSGNMSAAVESVGCVEGTALATEELPCTFVNGSEELQVAKQGYMSYVSQLTESCGDGDLMNYLDSVKLKKCYLWSMAGSNGDHQGEEDLETKDMEKELDELLLKPGDLERKWDLDSHGSNDTDELIEASSSLINELKNRDLTGSPGPEGAGDWKDVIVLWLDKNTKEAGQETDAALMDSEEQVVEAQAPLMSCSQDEVDSGRSRLTEVDGPPRVTLVRHSNEVVQVLPKPPPSFAWRVVTTALPIQILLYLYIILVLLLPCVVETSTGDCYFSLSDNLLMDSHRLGPIINYIRGPPPV